MLHHMHEGFSGIQLFSHLSGGVTLVTCGLLLGRYLARKSKNPNIIKKFHNIHKPLGHFAFVITVIHGLISIFSFPIHLIENISGLCAGALVAALFKNYHTREKSQGNWFRKHQRLSWALVPIMILHVITVNL